MMDIMTCRQCLDNINNVIASYINKFCAKVNVEIIVGNTGFVTIIKKLATHCN